jgi:Domain of Unknown Function with PDB structure (DUF3857)/Transglutaminase-like superfamily
VRNFFLSLFITITFLQSSFSQTPAIETEHWTEKPTVTKLQAKYSQEPAVTVMNKVRIEYIDNKDKNLDEYFTQHKIVHINNDHGIEYFNKIYINVNDFSDATEIRARTILPGGKIIELDKANIKDLKDEDGSLYKIFAFEGLENGSDIEFYYTLHKSTELMGKFRMQDRFPVMEAGFELIAPSRLVFELKPVHCQSDVLTDTLPGEKARFRLHFTDISALEEEKYSSYHVNLSRVEYKLSYNNALHPGVRMFTWNEYAKRIFAAYGTYSDKEIKKVSDLIGDNQWDKISSDLLKVITIENYIKKHINYRKDQEGDDVAGIETILKTRVANAMGLIRLYGAIFRELQINYQFVLAADRDEEAIDKNFENWNDCSNEMFYFPSLHHFLVPTKIQFRYPWIDPSWGDGNALFCKNISIGSMNSAIAEIKYVPLENYQQSYVNLESKLSLNSTMDSLLMDMKFLYGGYSAIGLRFDFDFLTSEQERDAIKEFSKNAIGSETILSSSIENRAFEDGNSDKPFILNIKVKSGDLLERAGNKILLKIGLVIGPQVEMYQEKERQLPMAMEFPHVEKRKIELIIPDGYQVRNPDDLRLKQVYLENGSQTMGFISDYTLKGNLLTIDIMEDYRKSSYPISQYEDFRKIINTSSDFNKVVLILEKK